MHQATGRCSDKPLAAPAVPGVTNIEWTINNRISELFLCILLHVSLRASDRPITAIWAKLKLHPQFFHRLHFEIAHHPLNLRFAELDGKAVSLCLYRVA